MRPLSWEGATCRLVLERLVLTASFLGILGCGPILPRGASVSEDLPPRSRNPQELFKGLAQRAAYFYSLRSLATVYYRGEDGRGTFQEAILVHRPDRLRLETLSPLGSILIVTVDANEVVGFHPREALFYRGRSSKENLLRYTQIPLELRELTSLLLGLPPVELRRHWSGGANAISWDLMDGRRETVSFDPALGVPVKWERLAADGAPEFSALFADFISRPAGLFPLKISLEAHAQQRRVEIRYEEPEVNVDLPSTVFVQQRPGNVREIALESLGG